MLAQLDLFTAVDQEIKSPEVKNPEIKPRKLAPPPVILVEEPVFQQETIPVLQETIPALQETIPALQETVSVEQETVPAPQESNPVAEKKSSRGRKSIREMSQESARFDIPEDEILFSKQYYGIGDVASMFQVNASLLRYWETEFDIIKPRKNKKGDRFYRPDDIKNLQMIHHLLREKKYTIEGARDFLKKSGKMKQQFEAVESLKKIRAFLLEMKAGL